MRACLSSLSNRSIKCVTIIIHSSARAFFFSQMSLYARDPSTEGTEQQERAFARKAGEEYLKSAELYPEDDENHPSTSPCL